MKPRGWSGCRSRINKTYSQEQRKSKVSIRTYPVREWYGIVLVWHERDGGAPEWEPPSVSELESGEYYPIGPTVRAVHRIKAHPQMVLENAADPYHVTHV